jgi:hypothetical protein
MTFRESLNVLGDRALTKLVGPVEAGACVPSAGHKCNCLPKTDDSCWSRNLPHKNTKYIFSCLGQCNVPVTQSCC